MEAWSFATVYDAFKKHQISIAFAFLCFIFLSFLFNSLIYAEEEKIVAKNKIEVSEFANVLKSQINSKFNALIYLTNGLSGYFSVYHHELDDVKVNQMLAVLFKDAKHIRNFGVAKGYRLKYVYPTQGNKLAINLDYREIPEQWPLVKKAIVSKQGVLAGPIKLIQGGSGLVYRYPIYVNNQYWGIVSTVIDTNSFLEDALNIDFNPEYHFSIRVKSTADQPSKVLYGDVELFNNPNALITNSNIANAEWEWAVIKTTKNSPHFILLAKLMSWLISVSLAILLLVFLIERKKLATRATTDSLTGLPNRLILNGNLNNSLKHSSKHKTQFAIMFIDIDYFKKINDTYGHDTGDEVLKIVSTVIAANIRSDDTLSRVGGDEFVVLLSELDQLKDAGIVATGIIKALEKPILINNNLINIKISIGISICTPEHKETSRSLMKKADIALYEAKGSGRNTYVIYSS
jgi:diguanylate cyclase